jgi:hypothetical protein
MVNKNYKYTFSVWFDDDRKLTAETIHLLCHLPLRIEMVMTEDEFNHYRSQLKQDGIVCRAITRLSKGKFEVIR